MADTSMTKEAFEAQYAHDSGITTFAQRCALGYLAVQCDCNDPRCRGWQMLIKLDVGDENAPKKKT